jgi:ABC-type Fe3+/spermidine/putrescine transport system ATPase subunit
VSAPTLRGVVKRFGELTAVNHLDLDVPDGTCVGLLGPNGAGKSTTMRLLTAQAIPDEGDIEILGFKLPKESKVARAACGVVPQLDNLDVTLTVEQNLLVFAHLYEHPDVHALHRGGRAPLRHAARVTVCSWPKSASRRVVIFIRLPPLASRSGDKRLRARRQRQRTPGRAAPDEPRGRLRPADRRGNRMKERIGRLERPAILGVLVREIINFSSFWRSSTFSATVEPTVYLLAFGFGFGSLVSKVGGYDYVDFVGTGTVATAVLFSSAFPGMFGTFVKYKFQRTYDAILAAPVDTDRQLQLRDQRRAHAAVPGCRDVLPDRRAARLGAGRRADQPPCTTSCSSSATRSSASRRERT